MNAANVLGAGLTVAGVAGYGVGLTTAYPGRAFALTAFMVGVALLAMRRAFERSAVVE